MKKGLKKVALVATMLVGLAAAGTTIYAETNPMERAPGGPICSTDHSESVSVYCHGCGSTYRVCKNCGWDFNHWYFNHR